MMNFALNCSELIFNLCDSPYKSRLSMKKLFVTILVCLAAASVSSSVAAQTQQFWIQIEAHGDVRSALSRARSLTAQFAETHAFRIPNGSYVIALGPFDRSQALNRNQSLIRSGLIPRNSFVTLGHDFVSQFWPVGVSANSRLNGEIETNFAYIAPDEEVAPISVSPLDNLGSNERDESEPGAIDFRKIQTALQWMGDYNSVIDGLYGPRTATAIEDYQRRNGFEVTGWLTAEQYAGLVANYEEELRLADLSDLEDEQAGIALRYPANLVEFSEYSPPFAIFKPADGENMRMMLVSMEGNAQTLQTLFDIVQSIDFVAKEGPRSLVRNEFNLYGFGSETNSFAHAKLRNGRIKGFVFAWPTNEHEVMNRISQVMRGSLREINDKTLDRMDAPVSVPGELEYGIGAAELEPMATASGFFVDSIGSVVTAADLVRSCVQIEVEPNYRMTVVKIDDDLGIAVLSPEAELSPIAFARLAGNEIRRGSGIAVSGHSYSGVLGSPSLTFGEVHSPYGLEGEANIAVINAKARQGDVGGPVLNLNGDVVGVLLPSPSDDRMLPEGINFAARGSALAASLTEAGIFVLESSPIDEIDLVELNRIAADITVLINCYGGDGFAADQSVTALQE